MRAWAHVRRGAFEDASARRIHMKVSIEYCTV